jgi:hypothetical protein
MSIQRIDIEHKRTHGWQARAYLSPGERLTAFFSDQANGDAQQAHRRAQSAEVVLMREARRVRRLRGA